MGKSASGKTDLQHAIIDKNNMKIIMYAMSVTELCYYRSVTLFCAELLIQVVQRTNVFVPEMTCVESSLINQP